MITLKNRYLIASFSPDTGGLTHLSAVADSSNLIRGSWCGYYERKSETWYGLPDFRKEAKPFEVVRFEPSERSIESVVRSPHVEVTQRFELDPGNSLLKI